MSRRRNQGCLVEQRVNGVWTQWMLRVRSHPGVGVVRGWLGQRGGRGSRRGWRRERVPGALRAIDSEHSAGLGVGVVADINQHRRPRRVSNTRAFSAYHLMASWPREGSSPSLPTDFVLQVIEQSADWTG